MPLDLFSKEESLGAREKIILGLISAMVAIPPFLWGGRDVAAQAIIFVFLLPLLFFIIKHKGRLDCGRVVLEFVFLAISTALMGISILYSPEKYEALKTFYIFFSGGLLCFLTFNFIDSYKKINYFGYLVLGLGLSPVLRKF